MARVGRRETKTYRAGSLHYPAPHLPLDELLALVALDRLLTVVGNSAIDRLTADVVAVPAAGLPPMRVVLAWTQSVIGEIAGAAMDALETT
jgi:predicted N-acetyltransferase YhbS